MRLLAAPSARIVPVALASAALAAVALSVSPARANGRFPTAQQLAPSPTDPTFVPMMATFGVVISKDTGASWDWVCEGAVGYDSSENPTLGVTANNTILAATFEGLAVTTDRGCTWSIGAAGITAHAVDLVVEAADPHTALLLTSTYLGQDDAGNFSYDSEIWATHDDGVTATQVGQSLVPDLIPETLDVAPSDPNRVYVSGTRRIAGVATGALLRSTNAGLTFAELDFPLVAGDAGLIDRAPYIAAVDPKNPDRVYVRVDNIDGTRLLVSDDGLVSTRQVWQAKGMLTGFVLSADGSKIYAGGPNDGLYVASRDTLAFTTPVWPGQVECLAIKGNDLLACSNEVSGFAVGASTDDGATWDALLHLGCVRGPLACGATSAVTTVCQPLWAAQQAQLGGVCPSPDAGSADAASPPSTSDAGGTSAPVHVPGASGGCASSPRRRRLEKEGPRWRRRGANDRLDRRVRPAPAPALSDRRRLGRNGSSTASPPGAPRRVRRGRRARTSRTYRARSVRGPARATR